MNAPVVAGSGRRQRSRERPHHVAATVKGVVCESGARQEDEWHGRQGQRADLALVSDSSGSAQRASESKNINCSVSARTPRKTNIDQTENRIDGPDADKGRAEHGLLLTERREIAGHTAASAWRQHPSVLEPGEYRER